MLESWLRSKTIPQALGMRARVVLLSGEGSSLRAIAQQLRLTERTVCLWRRRYQQEGVSGLRSRRRSGRPRRITRAKEFAVVTATSRLPPAATHWSARRLAKEMGVGFMTVHRIWRKYGLQPHRVETFKFSTDPEFDSKLADIVGLYLESSSPRRRQPARPLPGDGTHIQPIKAETAARAGIGDAAVTTRARLIANQSSTEEKMMRTFLKLLSAVGLKAFSSSLGGSLLLLSDRHSHGSNAVLHGHHNIPGS